MRCQADSGLFLSTALCLGLLTVLTGAVSSRAEAGHPAPRPAPGAAAYQSTLEDPPDAYAALNVTKKLKDEPRRRMRKILRKKLVGLCDSRPRRG
jgi:hypothetical protein